MVYHSRSFSCVWEIKAPFLNSQGWCWACWWRGIMMSYNLQFYQEFMGSMDYIFMIWPSVVWLRWYNGCVRKHFTYLCGMLALIFGLRWVKKFREVRTVMSLFLDVGNGYHVSIQANSYGLQIKTNCQILGNN